MVSVVLAAGLGMVTNLVTSTFTWSLAAFGFALVVTQALLSVWQARQEQRNRRTARDGLLAPLRPPAPEQRKDASVDARQLVYLLTAPFSPTPLWGRRAVHDELLAWCVDRSSSAGVVRVVSGPAGVGKSRLALAVAESLPAGWAAGRFTGNGEQLVKLIADAGEPTLVIVEDADRVAGLDTLILQASKHPTLVRLLMIAREGLGPMPETVLPQVNQGVSLTALGDSGDRQRWFGEAVRAYARKLEIPPPDLPDRAVGHDGDTPLIVHARALLAALGRQGTRTWSFAEIMSELVALELHSWEADLDRLPKGCDVEVLSQAVAVLLVLPARTDEQAADLLRRVSQYSKKAAFESRMTIARWARRRHPPGPDGRLDLRPHLVGERLVLDVLGRTNLLREEDTAAITALVRSYTEFPDALEVLVPLLDRQRAHLPELLAGIIDTGVAGHALDVALAALVDADDGLVRLRLITIEAPVSLRNLRAAISQCAVAHHRELVKADPDRYLPDLADALFDLGSSLQALGRFRSALGFIEESVELYRRLAIDDPETYEQDLAASLVGASFILRELGCPRDAVELAREGVGIHRRLAVDEANFDEGLFAYSLNTLGLVLRELGRPREAIEVARESVELFRRLAAEAPESQVPILAMALLNLGLVLGELGELHDAVDSVRESVEIHRRLVAVEPDLYQDALAMSITNLGFLLGETGQYRDALSAAQESVELYRGLVVEDPTVHETYFAMALLDLGQMLFKLGRPREALGVTEESLKLNRRLAASEPAFHEPKLAKTLINLSVILKDLERFQDALAAAEESVSLYRRLAVAEPDIHEPELAMSLVNSSVVLEEAGQLGEALRNVEESVDLYRRLASGEPASYQHKLAIALSNLAAGLHSVNRIDDAWRVWEEEAAVLKACAERDEKLYGPSYRRVLALLREKPGGAD
ncbi:tetratricopeptide repeat protein [Amycolatopsis vancoresmycina]|uniref:tetratricopeptide repeat protein n=1 Tax=Amycolatopsis vancoresmycina TaxID=208444 RepID=UPI00138DFB57|nr:tetratricopeptide repeat protein [Amycolatopsis vancoresmycina]